MAHNVESQTNTPAGELRDLIDRAERQLPALDAGNIEEYLVRLDRIDQLLGELAASNADLRPEQTRWSDLQERLLARAGKTVQIAGRAGGLATLRAAHPPAEGVWWHLDDFVAAQRKRSLRRAAVITTVVVVIALIAVWAYSSFLAPGPDVVLKMDTLNRVERQAREQQWAPALADAETALLTLPDDPDLLVWGAVLAERLGDQAKAKALLDKARQVMSADPIRLEMTISLDRLQAGDLDGAEQAAQHMVELDANDPQGYFMLASVAEGRGQTGEAIRLFEKTAALAETSSPQLAVISKMRMGMLMRQIELPTGDATDVATPASTAAP